MRRCHLKPEEKQQIGAMARYVDVKTLADRYNICEGTVRLYRRKAPKMEPLNGHTEGAASEIAKRFGYATPDPALHTLIKAYEDGKHARKQWGAGANCLYKGEHAQAWRMGFESVK